MVSRPRKVSAGCTTKKEAMLARYRSGSTSNEFMSHCALGLLSSLRSVCRYTTTKGEEATGSSTRYT